MGGAGAISRAGQVAIRKEQSSILLALTIALESVLERDGIDADADFFDELEADSLLIAQLCARLRSVPGLPPVAIKDVYQNPTAARLADHLEHQIAIAQTSHSDNRAGQRDTDGPRTTLHSSAAPASTASYWLCGALQLATFIVTALALSLTLSFGYEWVANGSGAVQTYLRAIIVGSGHFVGLALFPVALKWTLVGRFKVETIPIWSLRYFRFWLVKTALRANPVVLFAGTPVFPVYLRLLGARIGEGAVIFSRGMPVCTDLISIGSGAVIRRSAVFSGYRATGSVIQTGTVRIGDNAFVGEATVLEIDSEVGDGAQLGHSSSLGVGQSIPAGQRRVGVPATTDSDVDYMAVEAGLASTLRRFGYGLLQLSFHLLVTLPLPTVAFGALADWRWAMSETDSFLGISAGFDLVSVLILSGLVFVTLMVVRLALAVAAGRVLSVFVRPNTTYSLYGLHYMAQRGIERFTNSKFWTWLLGDTSYIVHYLKLIGYDVSFEKQTGSNFGTSVVHENPYYVSVGPGTMAADGFYALNNDYSSTSFRVNEVRVGSDSFFGNNIFYPSHSTVGDNCLLASKTVVPTSGERRNGVGFLGSPAFEIPRSVFRDQEFAELRESKQFPRLLRAKNRSNIASMILGLSHRYLLTTTVVAVAVGAIDAFDALGPLGLFATAIATAIVAPVYLAVAERASIGFRDLEPMHCSIYDRRSWRIERFWKLSSQPAVFNGTPFKSVMWRLYGVRVGKRLFDDGCAIIEKTMVTIGDDCVFNAGSLIQPHSQEDGSFKSDDIVIGSGVTLGVGSLVHYGVTMGDGATLDAASFLMKGSDVVPGSHWGENPSRELGHSYI